MVGAQLHGTQDSLQHQTQKHSAVQGVDKSKTKIPQPSQMDNKTKNSGHACTEENTWLSHDSIISKIRRSQCTSWLSNAQVKSFFGSNLRLASPRRSLTSQSLKWAKFCIRHTLTYTDIPWDTPQICIESVFLDITKGLHHNSVCSLLNEDTQGLMENCFGIFARGRRPQGLVQSNPKWNKIHKNQPWGNLKNLSNLSSQLPKASKLFCSKQLHASSNANAHIVLGTAASEPGHRHGMARFYICPGQEPQIIANILRPHVLDAAWRHGVMHDD